MILRPFEYVECASLAEASATLAAHGDAARLIAGGTALVPLMKHQVIRPGVLVSITRVPGLATIEPLADGGLRVGALATHHDVAASPVVAERSPLLGAACRRVASPTIRAMGTLGGNLCYGESASDPAPGLLALRASVRLAGPDGERVLPLDRFFTGFYATALRAHEILIGVEVPPLPPGARTRYLKWTPRAAEDRALIGLAAVLALDAGRVCRIARFGLGGVGPSPVVLRAAEASLEGQRLDGAAIAQAAEAAADEIEPIEDLQATADYRRDMLRVWVRRVVTGLAGDGATA